MDTGDTVQTSIGPLVLEDRVLIDPTSRQFEAGWWAFFPDRTEEDDPQYFISDDGVVYSSTERWPDIYDVDEGHVLGAR